MSRLALALILYSGVCGFAAPSHAFNIVVDYRYDYNNFFNTQQKRDALEAAAQRYSDIITTSLIGVSLSDNSLDPRIGFSHPGTGASYQVSAANSRSTDSLASQDPADEYRGAWSISQGDWILYAGGRSLSDRIAEGGSGTGLNFLSVFQNGSSHLNRGFRSTGSVDHLPTWGGAITFDNDGNYNGLFNYGWHFDYTTVPAGGTYDFYSFALHEIGHALGLNTNWLDWEQWESGVAFTGSNAAAAYNADNGTSRTSLNEVSTLDPHWQDGAYEAKIFAAGNPELVSTVGLTGKQDLLMEPVANFTAAVRRFELTTVDVAALEDIGWSVIDNITPSGDIDGDGDIDIADLGEWQRSDGSAAGLALWEEGFSGSAIGGVASVPEPSTAALVLAAAIAAGAGGRRPRRHR